MRAILLIVSVATTFLLGALAFNEASDTANAASTASQLNVVDGVLQSIMNAAAGPLVLVAGVAFFGVVFGVLLAGAAR